MAIWKKCGSKLHVSATGSSGMKCTLTRLPRSNTQQSATGWHAGFASIVALSHAFFSSDSFGLALRSHVAPSLLFLRSFGLARWSHVAPSLLLLRSFGLARRICLDRRFEPSLLLLRSVGLALRSHVAPSLLFLQSVGLACRICLDRRFEPSLVLLRSFGLARRIYLDRCFEPSLVLFRSFRLARWRLLLPCLGVPGTLSREVLLQTNLISELFLGSEIHHVVHCHIP